MTPAISVLIPVYNAQAYLLACLESVSAQTYTDFEIICIDDGSTDRSLQILQEYALKEPRLRFTSQKNAGVSFVRKTLLQQAGGKYVAFVDADDWLDKQYLEKMYHKAQETEADIVRGLFKQYNQQTGECAKCDELYSDYAANKKPPVNAPQRFQAGIDDSQVWGKLVRRDFLDREKINFYVSGIAEDVSFEILLYMFAGKIVFISEYLYNYRVGRKSSVTSNKSNMARGILQNLCFLCQELEQRGIKDTEVYNILLQKLIDAIKRLRHFPADLVNLQMIQEAFALIQKHIPHCSGWRKKKYQLFVWLVNPKSMKSMFFWSYLFR